MSLGYRSVVLNIIGKDNASKAFMTASRSAESAATRIDRSIARIQARSAALQAVGQKMTKFITLPLVALGAVAIKQAADFQKALNTIQVVTDQTDAQMRRTGEGLKRIAVKAATGLDQLTDSLYLVEKSGLRGKKALDVVRAAAEGAKAENADLGTVTNALTSVMASYGTKLKGGPVHAMNMLIEAAGLAKTTQQDFAHSLSNVVPIAASLGIKFQDIGAAIATMTQHGETAQHATENLRFMIQALAGQNNVASSMMQQFGINTVKLRTQLGKRGLVGTLDLVLNHLSKYSKAGHLVVDSFRNAGVAQKSLDTMMKHFTGTLLSNAEALRSGKMGYQDFRLFARGLGGDVGNMARQFLSLYSTSSGFNRLLSSGQGNVLTIATALQKMLGGIPGMNVALQLSGESAKRLHTYVQQIGDAASENGNKILGFAKTQQTAAFKADQLKAKIEVLAVNLGNQLLPVALAIVKQLGKMVSWFTHLSPATQHFIVKLGLLAAALGPVLALIGRLGKLIAFALTIGVYVVRFLAGMALINVGLSTYGTAAFQAGVRARMGFTTALTGVTALKIGIGSLVTGVLLGSLARGASGATQTMTALGSVAIGAAMGFSMGGGPWGAAIGGLIGGLSSVVTMFYNTADAAKASAEKIAAQMAAQQQDAQDLLGILQSVNGAYAQQYKAALSSKLANNGFFDEAMNLGIDPKLAMRAVMGQIDFLNNPKFKAAFAKLPKRPGTNDNLDWTKFTNDLERLMNAGEDAERHYEQQQKAQGKLTVSTKLLKQGTKGLAEEFKGAGHALAVYQKGRPKDPFNVPGGGNASDFSSAAKRNTQIIRDNILFLKQQMRARLDDGKSLTSTVAIYRKRFGALRDAFLKMKFDPAKLHYLLKNVLGALPKQVKPMMIDFLTGQAENKVEKLKGRLRDFKKALKAGDLKISESDAAARIARLQRMIRDLQTQIDNLRGKDITITINKRLLTTPGFQRANDNPGGATGFGDIPQGYFTVGERGWELGRRTGSKVSIYDHATSRSMTGLPARLPGYADGTPKIKHADDPEAFLHRKKNNDLLQGIVQAISGLLATAHNMRSSSADFRSAARALMQAARQGKISADEQAAILKTSKRLDRLSARRDQVSRELGTRQPRQTAYEKLAAAREDLRQAQQGYRTTVNTSRDAARGQIDVTSIGQNSWGVASSSSIVTTLKAMATKAKQFARVLKRLIKMGLPRYIVEQLAQAGPVALSQAQAFAAASPKELRSIKSSYRTINDFGRSAGQAVANAYDTQSITDAKKSVERAHNTVERLLGKRKDLNKAIRASADDMIRELEKALGIKLSASLSRHHDDNKDGRGRRRDGDGGGDGHHRRRRGGDSGHHVSQTFNIYGVTDPDALTKAIARRLARTVA